MWMEMESSHYQPGLSCCRCSADHITAGARGVSLASRLQLMSCLLHFFLSQGALQHTLRMLFPRWWLLLQVLSMLIRSRSVFTCTHSSSGRSKGRRLQLVASRLLVWHLWSHLCTSGVCLQAMCVHEKCSLMFHLSHVQLGSLSCAFGPQWFPSLVEPLLRPQDRSSLFNHQWSKRNHTQVIMTLSPPSDNNIRPEQVHVLSVVWKENGWLISV